MNDASMTWLIYERARLVEAAAAELHSPVNAPRVRLVLVINDDVAVRLRFLQTNRRNKDEGSAVSDSRCVCFSTCA